VAGVITVRDERMSVVLLFLILTIVCGGYYLFFCWRYPRVPRRWCSGKAPRDPLIRRAFGQCGHCHGSGYRDRLGTKMLGKGKR
jgi:hypothetical protein